MNTLEESLDNIIVIGAKEHNLKDIDVKIPRNKLVVITGISGSGKSSLAFDTIYAEGQRRYMETFSAYVRQFIGKLERPNVESIDGLSPVISIEQKTTGWNPRSTVGTVTEIYDFMRLLFARASDAYSYLSGRKMVKYTEDEIIDQVWQQFEGMPIAILAPIVKGRKGHYRELLESVRKQGFTKVRIDGEWLELKPGLMADRYKTHDIEVVVDRIKAERAKEERMVQSLQTALKMGEGILMITNIDTDESAWFSKNLMDAENGLSYEEPNPNSFSFNTPYGACPTCDGLAMIQQVDMEKVIPDDSKSINDAGIVPLGEPRDNMIFTQLRSLSKKYKFSFATPIKEIPAEAMDIILHGAGDQADATLNLAKSEYGYNLLHEGLNKMLYKWYSDTSSEKIRSWAEDFLHQSTCPDCKGLRLKQSSLSFRIDEKNISELTQMDLDVLQKWLTGLEDRISEKQRQIARDVLKEIRLRLQFLLDVGLEYLTLDRQARTLSGGESQRTRLANQIGSQLTGITYIMDEPSIGLHQRDNQKLIKSLLNLTAIGNSVIVVEHDKDIMLASDFIIDLGPGAGSHGGELVGQGTPEEFLKLDTLTAEFLSNKQQVALPASRRTDIQKFLILEGATGNNLKNVTLKIPLGTFMCITGVSGSGKSSLINDTLYPILRKHFYRSIQEALPFAAIHGLEHIDKVVEIDQSPIGRTPRSNPATYTNVFSDIRKIFSDLPEAKIRGYKPGRFSFNVKGGRCEMCEGGGKRVIEMNFLPDVLVDCESCLGKRYNRETLEILFKGKSISDVLDMTVEEAATFFENVPSIYRKVRTLLEVGLGYITLGQQATTLSGGEAQRVKLAEELSKKDTGKTLYILDEPTTGLHFEDIRHLLDVLHKLVSKGNTVVVIEHNMDVIKVADHIIDLGPEGGSGGGHIVCEGTPEMVADHETSYTGYFLKRELALHDILPVGNQKAKANKKPAKALK
jgi:excinuclease ABC subunit A